MKFLYGVCYVLCVAVLVMAVLVIIEAIKVLG